MRSAEDLEKEMRTLFTIGEEKDVRLWNRYMSNTYEHLSKPENTLQDVGLFQGQVGSYTHLCPSSCCSYNKVQNYMFLPKLTIKIS